MTHFQFKWTLVCLGLVGPAVLAGCTNEARSQEVEHVGTLTAALATTGSDGAVYKFPAGSTLLVQSDTFAQNLALDGADSSLSLRIPAGTFTASFSPAPLQLEKTVGASTALVNATLLNTLPLTFVVVENQTTTLDLKFQVQGLGDITFSPGQLLVTLSVVKVDGTASRTVTQGSTTVTDVSFDPSASPAAKSLLGVNVGDAPGLGVTFQTSGTWRLANSASACISGQVVSVSFPGGTGFGARMAEELNGTGDFCVIDFGATDTITLRVDNFTTPADQTATLPSTYDFALALSAPLTSDIFDGVNLRQSALESITQSTGGTFFHGVFDRTTNQFLTQMNGTFAGQVQAIP
jgi:hypothetical protein